MPKEISTDKKKQIERTEEIQDIVEQMPRHTGRRAVILVVALTAIMLCLGWVIKYPEVAAGSITITARQSPVKLVAKASGKLKLLGFKTKDFVKEGTIFAVIESSADLGDVLHVDSILQVFNPSVSCKESDLSRFPRNVNLGELTETYYRFLNALELKIKYPASEIYRYQKLDNELAIQAQEMQSEHIGTLMSVKDKSRKIVDSFLRKDSLQYYRIKGIAESDLEKTKLEAYTAEENLLSLKKEMANTQAQISELHNKANQLGLDQQSYEQKIDMDFASGYGLLMSGVRQWLLNYTLRAPFSGRLEFLDFWKSNDFVEAGKELFSILPDKNYLQGNVYLPVTGAGKVAVGQDVNIKLENYPYMEYGVIEGRVKSVSILAGKSIVTQQEEKQSSIPAYLVIIELPHDLTTNYGTNLGFQYEVKGIAEIVTSKRRLLERLFDNLKYIAKVK